MAVGLELPPKGHEALAPAIGHIVSGGNALRNREKIRWLIATQYLQGVRQFDNIDWSTGSVTSTYNTGILGDERLRIERVVSMYMTEIGRFMQMDLAPVVTRRGKGLDDLRKASTGQLVLDNVFNKEMVETLAQTLIPCVLRGGHIGLLAVIEPGKKPHPEIIPGWELMSSPVDPPINSNIDALLRIRWVTLPWLIHAKVITAQQAADNKSLLNIVEMPVGSSPESSGAGGGIAGAARKVKDALGLGRKSPDDKRLISWVRFVEVWQRDREDYQQRYLAMAGDYIAVDNSYEPQTMPMMLQCIRYADTGGFYGRSFVEQLIPLNSEAEFLTSQVLRNIEDMDAYGMLCLSSKFGLSLEEVQEARQGSKVLIYDPDVYNPTNQPFVLPPANTGSVPLDAVELVFNLMAMQAPQPEMLRGDAPGRVDSARALSILNETSNIPLTGPAESLSIGMARMYRALLWLAKDGWGSDELVSLSLDDDVLVGVEYNKDTGMVTLRKDAIPHPDEVRITVAAKLPRSDAELKAELKDHLSLQLITPRQYRIQARVLGLDLPVANEQEWQAWRKAKLENLVLYGDGEDPGTVATSPRDYHEVHLEVLSAFIARPEYPLASEKVQNAFVAHYNDHAEALGDHPEGLPYPGTEDSMMELAEQRMAMEQEQGAGQNAQPDTNRRL